MDLVALLPAFVVAVLLISLSPGPAMALIFRRAAVHGRRASLPTLLGLEAGLLVWALCAGAGVAALVTTSEVAFVALRTVGAAFLFFLGIKAWMAVRRNDYASVHTEAEKEPRNSSPPRSANWWKAFSEGALVMLANPKAVIFLIAFYPQFVPPGRPLLSSTVLLVTVQVSVEIVFYLFLVAAVSRAGAWFRRPTIRRRLDAVSGGVLIGLGLRLATTTR